MNHSHLYLTIFFTGVKITLQISNHSIRMICHRTQKGEYPQNKTCFKVCSFGAFNHTGF